MKTELKIDSAGFDGNLKKLEDAVIRLQKDLNFLLQKLDSSNIISINTDITPIKSADGSFCISGKNIKCGNNFEVGFRNNEFVFYASPSGSGTFKSADGKTVHYSNGIILKVV